MVPPLLGPQRRQAALGVMALCCALTVQDALSHKCITYTATFLICACCFPKPPMPSTTHNMLFK